MRYTLIAISLLIAACSSEAPVSPPTSDSEIRFGGADIGQDSAQADVAPECICGDDNPCTFDTCTASGQCVYTPKTCDDGNPCTQDGQCKNINGKGTCTNTALPDLSKCDDGDPATGNTCKGGKCVVVDVPDCVKDADCPVVTGKECFTHVCDVALGKCVTMTDDGVACNDSNACTEIDMCQAGKCAGSPKTCDDSKPCTTDSCAPSVGCTHEPLACPGLTEQCYDAPIGVLTTAALGKCAECTVDNACDDMLPCTVDSCDPNTGKCIHASQCDDNNLCTLDTCEKSGCVNTKKTCADGNPCTEDLCSFKTGACSNPPTTAAKACDDGDPCTDDSCDIEFGCKHTPKVCADDNICTDDSCLAKVGCTFMSNSKACDDNNACTVGEQCLGGTCGIDYWGGVGDFVDCWDGSACTKDICDPKTGDCSYQPLTGNFCTDYDSCTVGETCNAGKCAGGSQKICDDGNPCTFEVCESLKGCVSSPIIGVAKACNDGDECTTGDVCSGGSCAGMKKVCNDNNACTLDTCDPKKGCVFTDNDKMCDDGNVCTLDSCDPITACKVLLLTGNTCDDSKADTFNDICQAGACKGTPKIPCAQASDCGDGNPCTTDICDQVKGCVFTNNALSCKDNNPCNGEEVCANGACMAGTPIVCNDGNACTTDSCDPASGCKTTPVAAGVLCTSGNLCSKDDACSADGTCVAGPAKSCDDNNPCTADSCAPSAGCQNLPIAGCVPPNVCLRWSNPGAASKIAVEVNGCLGTYGATSGAFFCEEGWAKKATKTDMSATETFTWCSTVPSGKALQVALTFDPCIVNETVGYCSKNSPAGKGKDAGLVLDIVGKHELSLDGGKTYAPVVMSTDTTKAIFVIPNPNKDGGNLVIAP